MSRYLLLVVVVRALDVLRCDLDPIPVRLHVHQGVPHFSLLGDLELVLVGFEVRAQLGVRGFEPGPEFVRGQRHDRELDLLVPAPELPVHFVVADGNPVRERRLQLLDRHTAPHLLFEFIGPQRRVLDREHLPIPLFADEPSVFLQGGERGDALPDLLIGRRDPQPRGFRECRLFLEHLLDDALVDPELLQHPFVDIGPVGAPIGLHLLLVDATEARGRDVAAVHGGDDLVVAQAGRVGLQEAGNVENDEREDHNGEAPLEPASVSAHPVEHRHVS